MGVNSAISPEDPKLKKEPIYCAFDSNRICNDSCAAIIKNDTVRYDEYFWDTSDPTPQYKQLWTTLERGSFCKRLGYLVGSTTVIAVNGKEVI